MLETNCPNKNPNTYSEAQVNVVSLYGEAQYRVATNFTFQFIN